MENVFTAWTKALATVDILTGCSANIEVTAEGRLPNIPGIMPGHKNLMKQITVAAGGPEDTTCQCEIETMEGQTFVFQLSSVHSRVPAGSSVNIAFVLSQLGLSNVGVIAPMDRGRHSRELCLTLRESGMKFGLFPADRAAFALNVREPGRSTILFERPSYEITQPLLATLETFTPACFIASGVKPRDVPLVEMMFAHAGNMRRIFAPHLELTHHAALRPRMRRLMQQADLVHLNDREAAVLLGKTEFHTDDIRSFGAWDVRLCVVTIGAAGSLAFSCGEVKHQPCVPAVLKDTCGAGDAHLAALLYALWLGEECTELAQAMRFAACIAAEKVAHVGPWSGIPRAADAFAKLAL